jgi:hypothetical protein
MTIRLEYREMLAKEEVASGRELPLFRWGGMCRERVECGENQHRLTSISRALSI